MTAAELRRALRHPLAAVSAAGLALALPAWIAGPLAALPLGPLADPAARVMAVAAVALGWGLAAVAVRIRRETEAGEAAGPPEEDDREARERAAVAARAEILRRKLDEALALLGRNGPRGRQARAKRLPWILVVGPTGSGKSALLDSAGLALPFGPPPGRGAPADDCSFVIGEDAVFVDVAGRLPQAAAGSSDAAVWLRLLDALCRQRPLQPVGAIVLTLDASRSPTVSEEEVIAGARAMRLALDRAAERLGARPPVYLAVTMLDALLGFTDFFEALGRAERERAWGIPMLAGEDEILTDPAVRFGAGFADLVGRAAARQMRRLHEEPDALRRVLAFEFPAQLAALETTLKTVVEIVALPHRFGPPPFLRGVFLCCARAAGPAVDLIGLPAAAGFGQKGGFARLARPGSSTARSFFTAGLVRDLVVRDAGRSGTSRRARRLLAGGRVACAAVLATAAAIALARWAGEARATHAYAAALAAEAGGLKDALAPLRSAPVAPPFAALLPALDRFQRLDRPPPPGARRVERLAAAAWRAAAAGLDRLFLPGLDARLRATLADEAASAPDALAALQLALAIGGAPPPRPLDLTAIASTLGAAWFPDGPAAERRGVCAAIAALGRHPPPPRSTDPALLERARRRLAGRSPAGLALDLARRDPAVADLPGWRPIDHAGDAAALVLAVEGGTLWDGIPGLYTRAAFQGAVAPAIRRAAREVAEAGWALDGPRGTGSDAIAEGAFALYAADYTAAYDALLSRLTVRPMGAAGDAARALSMLMMRPSPVSDLLRAVAAETDLPASADDELEARSGRAVAQAFAPLRRAAAEPADRPTRVEGALGAFEPLEFALLQAAEGGDPDELGLSLGAAMLAVDAAVVGLPAQTQPLLRRMERAVVAALPRTTPLRKLDGSVGAR